MDDLDRALARVARARATAGLLLAGILLDCPLEFSWAPLGRSWDLCSAPFLESFLLGPRS